MDRVRKFLACLSLIGLAMIGVCQRALSSQLR
jgi:hypothetical protein